MSRLGLKYFMYIYEYYVILTEQDKKFVYFTVNSIICFGSKLPFLLKIIAACFIIFLFIAI